MIENETMAITIVISKNMTEKLEQQARENARSRARQAAIMLCESLGLNISEEFNYDRG